VPRLLPIAAVALVMRATAAFAGEPEVTVRAAPSFVLAEGLEGLAQGACVPGAIGEDLLIEATERALHDAALDPQIAIVLASGPLNCGSLFYLPLANDVRGIGYRHEDGREVFDDTPDSRLEGVAFLNDWPYWRERPDEFGTAFLHEVGHRWGARVHAEIDGVDSDELLGRQRKHWSYFAETHGSPLEGNRFRDLGEERFEASTPLGTSAFSQLDLYLMGLVSPEDVEPFGLLRADAMALRDCKDVLLSEVSPPQFCEPLAFSAERIEVSIDDILAVEGPREPSHEDAPRSVDVVVLVLSSNDDEPMLRADCAALSTAIDEQIAAFEIATGERMRLINLARSEAVSCEGWPVEAEMPAPAARETAKGCAVAQRACSGRAAPLALLALACLLWSRRRRRTRRAVALMCRLTWTAARRDRSSAPQRR
jgi:hypothetical protein